MGKRILIVGGANMDFIMDMRAMPPAGESVTEGGRYRYAAGGRGALAALSVTRLGGSALLSARLGSDIHGDRLYHMYKEAGVDTRYISRDKRAPTPLRVVMREDNGNSRIVFYPGAGADLSLADVERAVVECRPAALYLHKELPRELSLGLFRLAADADLPVTVDYSSEMPLSSLGECEIFCLDNKAVYELTGTFPVGSDSCLKAAVELEKKVRAHHFVIRLGDRGVFTYDGRYCHVVPGMGIRMPEGASLCDALTAALLLEYLESEGDIKAACRFGMSLNTLLLKNSADPAYFPSAAEVRAFAKEH